MDNEKSALIQLVCNTSEHKSITFNDKGDYARNIATSQKVINGNMKSSPIIFKIINSCDIIGKMYIKLKVKEKYEDDKEYYAFNYIKLYISNILVDNHTGEWLHIESMLMNDKSIYDNKENIYYIPLQFWFNKEGNAHGFPLSAIPGRKMSLEIKLTSEDENIISIDLLYDAIFLNSEERKIMLSSDINCSIEQIEHISQIKTTNLKSLNLILNQSICKELI